MNVLLVDDDRELTGVLELTFRRSGLSVGVANDAESGLRLYRAERPDVVVLDINLGLSDGVTVLREIRRSGRVPVIMLTARDSEDDKVRALDLGADDYVTKPFGHRELVARVRRQMRRGGLDLPGDAVGPVEMRAGPLSMDVARHAVTRDGVPIALTVTEFRLLHALLREAGRVIPSRRLLKQVWGLNDPGGSDVLRVTVHRLRRKLGDDGDEPRLIRTVPGVGVILENAEDATADT